MNRANSVRWALITGVMFGLTAIADAVAATTTPDPAPVTTAKSSRSHTYSAAGHDAIVLSGATQKATVNKLFEVFIYDADVHLLYDDDNDGFFHGLEVNFDADTTEFATTLYARLYLRRHEDPWTLYFQTPVFSVFGASPDDDYFVVTELLSGYDRAQYDLMIELYEANEHTLVAEFGPWDSPALSQLPLEAQQHDRYATSADTISYSGGGGGLGLLGLAVLFLARLRHVPTF